MTARDDGTRDDNGARPRDQYHHGDLRQALVAATEEVLAERGVEGFTLREAARRVGVSPAAPAHHFGSAAGLLTEVAVLGFEALTRYLREGAAAGGTDPAARLRGQGLGYVRFALAYPARFQLMFRRDRLDRADPRLQAAGQAAFAELEQAIRAHRGRPAGPLGSAGTAELVRAWSVVHGFAHLALEQRLARFSGDSDVVGVERLLRDVLAGLWPDRAAKPAGRRNAGVKRRPSQ